MKSLTFILAAIILYLAIKPGLDSISLQTDTEKSCCAEQCTPFSDNSSSQGQKKGNDSKGKSCNPFQLCGSCFLVDLNSDCDYLLKLAASREKSVSYQSAFTSQFASDFWQPPKIV